VPIGFITGQLATDRSALTPAEEKARKLAAVCRTA